MTEARTALVTGGASGIGLAITAQLVREGWQVIAADRDAAALPRAAALGDAVRCEILDVTDEAAVEALLERLADAPAPLRGVVNSAGIGRDVPALDTTVAMFRQILEVNLLGTFAVGRAAAARMARHGGGAVVNLASVAGVRGSKGRAAYGASKGGVITLTQVLATEWAPLGIRVNAVAPGPVETPLVAAMHDAATREQWMRHVPQKRYAQPEEVAHAVCFLLDGARSGFITGEVLAVDGGFRGAGLLA